MCPIKFAFQSCLGAHHFSTRGNCKIVKMFFVCRGYATDAESKFITRLVKMRVVKNQTTNGKVAHFSALVVAGNGHGGLGFAQAKHSSGPDAIQKATKKAIKSMEFFPRWQDRTIFHDDYTKFKATKLYARPAPPSTLMFIMTIRYWTTLSSCHCRDMSLCGD